MRMLFIAAALTLASHNAVALTKCVPDGRGGMCCWDVNKDGPFKPILC